ncbi:nucleic acid-binding protein [Colletotrichum asianum]
MSDFSIQAFYKKEVPTSSVVAPTKKHPQDDGFTQAEVEAGNNPLDRRWDPSDEYHQVCIANIQPGPALIRFTGRIVNYTPAFLDSKNTYTRPAHQLIVKDDTGAIAVKLVPIGIPVSLLLIGQLVTVWASWTGTSANTNQGNIPFVTMYTPINSADIGTKQFIQFITDTPTTQNIARVPLDYERDDPNARPLPNLMTLGQYLKTGHDTAAAIRLIVCVKSIGSRKRVTINDRREAELVEVTDDKANSAKLWKPNDTILLLTSPKFSPPRETKPPKPAGVGLTYNTLIDVDPDFPDGNWLHQWVKNRVKKECICIPFPKDVWNAEVAVHGPIRPLFTLSEVDEFARADPAMDFTGKLCLTVLGLDLLGLYRRKMLCCIECCGVPLHANHSSATCKNCMTEKTLVLNPRVMGILVDETGCIAQGKLVWSEEAWGELFFPTDVSTAVAASVLGEADSPADITRPPPSSSKWMDILQMDTARLRLLEEQMLYARFTLTFGWSPFVERLCVLGVEW